MAIQIRHSIGNTIYDRKMLDTTKSNDSTDTMVAARYRWTALGACLLCMAVSVGSSALILPFQSIWLDESTQMSGLERDPIQVARWLAFREDSPRGIMHDRMPPLSYWM